MTLYKSERLVIDRMRDGWKLVYDRFGVRLIHGTESRLVGVSGAYKLFSNGFIRVLSDNGTTRIYGLTEKGAAVK